MNMPPDPRVMHIIYNLEQGGAQEVLCVLAEAVRGKEEEFIVCALGDGPMRFRLEDAGAIVNIIPAPCCSYRSIIRYAAELRRIGDRIAELAKHHEINLIQTHVLGFLDLAVMCARKTSGNPAILWTFHGDFLPWKSGYTLWARRILCRWMYRITAAHVDAIICVSRDLSRAVFAELGNLRHKVRIIRNAPGSQKTIEMQSGEVVRSELGLIPRSRIVLFLGRLAAAKGCDFLIKAAPIVLADLPDTVFLIAGEGPEAATLKSMAEHAGVHEQIRFLGVREDTANLFAAADVFCLPSRQEGMSLSLLEAMSAGKPVVVSDLAANREVVEHEKTGLFVNPGDTKALAEALICLLSHPDKARAMGCAAMDYARTNYSVSAQREAYSRLYGDILAARASM